MSTTAKVLTVPVLPCEVELTAGDLTRTVTDIAGKIASKSMVTVRTGKQAFYRQRDLPLAEAYAYTARVMTENLLQRDAEEGISAFIAKRPPNWTDEP